MPDPQGFLKIPREEAHKRPAQERVKDWREFILPMGPDTLRAQATRCMDCGVPFCHVPPGCPVENRIPDWNRFVSQGRWDEAQTLLHSTNNFPEFTGRLCPAPCESACVLGVGSDPVTIRSIELEVAERAFADGRVQPVLSARRSGKRVAIVGSGPAGLAAAQQLVRAGHEVVVYERADRPGGLLRYGIPDFKMEKEVLDRRLSQLVSEGVRFQTSTEVGVDVPFEALRKDFDAVCLTVGAEQPRDVRVPGRELRGIHFAMEYLIQQNRRIAGDPIDPAEEIHAAGKRVIILGGGDTGSDCLGTANRQGCRSAMQFEIQPCPPESAPETWPYWPLKLRTSHAHEEGGTRVWEIQTLEFLGSNGRVSGLRCRNAEGVVVEFAADLVLIAAGFTGPMLAGLSQGLALQRDSRGGISVDREYATRVPGVFAAGDARRGASLIVWAIAEGRRMAAAVDRFLAREHGMTLNT